MRLVVFVSNFFLLLIIIIIIIVIIIIIIVSLFFSFSPFYSLDFFNILFLDLLIRFHVDIRDLSYCENISRIHRK